MGYEREFDAIPRREFGLIDRIVTETLHDFVPDDQYMMRDVILTDQGVPRVVEREKGRQTPITRDVQYREIRERQPLQDIKIHEPIPRSLGLSRWFNSAMEAVCTSSISCVRARQTRQKDCVSGDPDRIYCPKDFDDESDCAFMQTPALIDVVQNDLDGGEFSFFVPREPTLKDQEQFDERYQDHILSYVYYRLYHTAEGNTYGLTFSTPNFRMIYQLRRAALTQAATAFAFDPDLHLANRGIDPKDMTYAQMEELDELYDILKTKRQLEKKEGREVAMSEAVREYGELKGIKRSTERQSIGTIVLQEPATWVRARQLLCAYIDELPRPV